MKNFPVHGINKDTGAEVEVWFDRSVVVANFVFCKNSEGNWCVLAAKRGSAATCEGFWNCQGGFIDFDEDDKQAAIRECYEETGVKVDPQYCKFYCYITKPQGAHQHIAFRWYSELPGTIDDYVPTIENCEPNECTEAKWIPISELKEYKFCFNHKSIIYEILRNKIGKTDVQE